MAEIEWLEYWRVIEGDVVKSRGYMDGDYVVFDVDPDDPWQEQMDDDDPRRVHVDDIYEQNGVFELEDETAAKKYAIDWLNKKVFDYQLKLARLHGTNSVTDT